jgi:hypothetical protein
MKRSVWTALLMLMLFFNIGIQAQQGLPEVADALSKGNAQSLSPWFHSTVNLTVLHKEGSYSKAQAEQIVQNFFMDHPSLGFQVLHQGSSGDQARYVIGELKSTDQVFRVYLLYKTLGGEERIQTLRFERNE